LTGYDVEETPEPQGMPAQKESDYRKGTTPPEEQSAGVEPVKETGKRKGKKPKKVEKQDWDKISSGSTRKIQDVNRITVEDVAKGQSKAQTKNKVQDLIMAGAKSKKAKDGSTLYTGSNGERLLVVNKDGITEWEANK